MRYKILLYPCIFILLFSTIYTCYTREEDQPIFPDTYGYLIVSLKNPWKSHRTPGLGLYLRILGARDPLRTFIEKKIRLAQFDDINTSIATNPPIRCLLRNLRLANACFLGIGLTLLSIALSRFFPIPNKCPWLPPTGCAILTAFCVWGGRLVPMNFVLADTLTLILTPYVLGCLLFFLHGHKFRWLLAASLLAAYTFLVKPAFAFLPFLCGLICAWQIIVSLLARAYAKARSALLIGITLSLCTLAWPLWLYWHGGIFVPSQIAARNNACFAFFLAQPGDERLFKDDKLQTLIKRLVKMKSEVAVWAAETMKLQYPPQGASAKNIYFHSTLNEVITFRIPGMLAELGYPPNKKIEWQKTVMSFAPVIIGHHFGNYIEMVVLNFVSAFNQLEIHHAHAAWISDHYKIVFIFILLGILIGNKQLRIPILLFIATHILHMLFLSIGLCIEQRYVETTEIYMFFSFLISLYSLALQIYKKYNDIKYIITN